MNNGIRYTVLSLLLLSIIGSCAPLGDSGAGLTLREIADMKGKKIGAAVVPARLAESDYANTLKKEFNAVVGENCMKWVGFHTADNTYDYSQADTLVTFAQTNAMAIRGHCFLWHNSSQRPAWLAAKATGYTGIAGSDLELELKEHIENAIDHFGNKVYAWDVVNEVLIDPWISDPPDYSNNLGLRNKSRGATSSEYSFWAVSENDDYLLKKAFYIADAKLNALGIRGQVRLFACDYTNEQMGTSKADQFYKLIQAWVMAGVPIDRGAFQLHLSYQYGMPDSNKIRNAINRLKALKTGFEVHFSEIDIAVDTTNGVSDTELANQAGAYASLMAICHDYAEVTSYFTWGITDKYSWLSAKQYGDALIFDTSYQPKPCYDAIRQELLK
jgi:endo-1,4-beta-xylanase